MDDHLFIDIGNVCLSVLHFDQPLFSVLTLHTHLICERTGGTHVESNLCVCGGVCVCVWVCSLASGQPLQTYMHNHCCHSGCDKNNHIHKVRVFKVT